MPSAPPSSPDDQDRTAFIHQEILQIGVLLLLAVAAFLLTRAVAASNRDMNLRNAAAWYARGRTAIEAGRVDEAIDAFRRANVRNRDERSYALALARALAAGGDAAAARNALLALRQSAPEDPEINLELARDAAGRADLTGARRFYHNALYAPWPAAQDSERRAVRLELVRFLLSRGEVPQALSELLALRTDLPDEAALHVDLARLFAQAGDHTLALEAFQRAIALEPEHAEALGGAAEAAFALGQYPLARRLLLRAPASADLRRTREIVDLVLSRDPLAARVGYAERRRRLLANFSYAEQRWDECVGTGAGDQPADAQSALRIEARAFADHVTRAGPLGQDAVEAGVDMVNRLEQRVVERCGPPTPLDSALLLIARRHGADAR